MLAAGAALLVARAGVACSPAATRQVQAVADLVEYERTLDACMALGRDAGSYDVYRECADRADAHLCQTHGVCRDGGAP